MILQLKYNDDIQRQADACFLRGNDPAVWLKEMSGWQTDPETLECYMLPESVHSSEPAGLFVVFKQKQGISHLLLKDAYYLLAEKLFIPVNSELYPQIGEDELAAMLLWPAQVLHPVSGLTGFDEVDEVHLAELLELQVPGAGDWSFAHPGLPEKPPLHHVNVVPPASGSLIDSVKKELDNKPLSEIPVPEV